MLLANTGLKETVTKKVQKTPELLSGKRSVTIHLSLSFKFSPFSIYFYPISHQLSTI